MSLVQELGGTVQRVADEVGPSIVGLGRRRAHGTGVVIAEGRILTNSHNLRREEVTLTFADGREESARIAAIDVDGDLAVLEVDTGDAPPISWNGSEDILIGTPVFALANPGGRGLRVTFGLVSATGRTFRGPRGRRIGGSIEHSAPLVRGSSGSPLVDPDGRLLGLNTVRRGEGFCLAIAADESLRTQVDALGRGEAPTRPRLGIAIAPPRVARRLRAAVGLPVRDGVLVRAVQEDSPAQRAGIEQGDLVTEIESRQIDSTEALYQALDDAAQAGKLSLLIVRGTEERTVEVTL